MEDNSLIVLGCSSATPNSVRFPSAQVLKVPGKVFLFDCGEGTQIQLRRAHVGFDTITAVFISHLHGDHFFGIFGLLASLNLTGRRLPLTIYAPQGFEEIVRFQFKACAQPLSFDLHFVTLPKEPFSCIVEKKNYKIYAIQLSHRIDCWGFYYVENQKSRNILKSAIETYNLGIEDIKYVKDGCDLILENGEIVPNADLTIKPPKPFSFAYIADTIYKPEIAEYIQNVRLMYHEATFLNNMKQLAAETYHSTAEQAAQCATLAHAEKLILGHYSARYKTLDGHYAEASQVFENVELANDLHLYSLRNKPQYIGTLKNANE